MLKKVNLKVSITDKEILSDIALEIHSGEIKAIMGPNVSGKSTLSAVLAGKPGYTIADGSITFFGKTSGRVVKRNARVLAFF